MSQELKMLKEGPGGGGAAAGVGTAALCQQGESAGK